MVKTRETCQFCHVWNYCGSFEYERYQTDSQCNCLRSGVIVLENLVCLVMITVSGIVYTLQYDLKQAFGQGFTVVHATSSKYICNKISNLSDMPEVAQIDKATYADIAHMKLSDKRFLTKSAKWSRFPKY